MLCWCVSFKGTKGKGIKVARQAAMMLVVGISCRLYISQVELNSYAFQALGYAYILSEICISMGRQRRASINAFVVRN